MTAGLLKLDSGMFVNMLSPVDRLHPLNRGLVARWQALPGLTGGRRLIDLVNPGPHGRHGTLTNMDPATDWVGTSRPGGYGALDFDGSDDRVAVADVPVNGDFTLITSVNIDSLAVSTRMIGSSTNYLMAWNATTIFFRPDGGSASSAGHNFAVNEWTNITLRRSGTTLEWFSNGSSLGTATDSRNGTFSSIGADTGGVSPFPGQADDIRLYNRALSASEVRDIYHTSQLQFDPTLNWIRQPRFVAAAGGDPEAGLVNGKLIRGGLLLGSRLVG